MRGLNRKILYQKDASLGPIKRAVPAVQPPEPKEGLIEWVAIHPLINISGLAIICGIDRGNLTNWIKAGKIPDKHAGKIEQVLKDYGYCRVVRTFKP